MSPESDPQALTQLRRLIDQLLDGELSIEDRLRLEQLICSSEACSDYYVQTMHLVAEMSRCSLPPMQLSSFVPTNATELQDELFALGDQVEVIASLLGQSTPPAAAANRLGQIAEMLRSAGTEASEASRSLVVPRSVQRKTSRQQDTRSRLAMFGAAMLLLGLASGWIISQTTDQKHTLVAQSSEDTLVLTPAAYLTSANGVSWGGASPAMHRVGGSVGVGEEVAVHEGLAEFRLVSGVSLSIEGPATLVITSPTSLMLQQGKVAVQVPWEVKDFRVLAATYEITAREAEFGVVASRGKLEVHSFVGETRLSPTSLSASFASGSTNPVSDEEDEHLRAAGLLLVAEGQALQLDLTGDAGTATKNLLVNRARFATKLSMGSQLPVTQRYVDAVLESGPVSYWRFEAIDGRQVQNEVAGEPPLHVVGSVVLAGDPRNYSVEIGSTPGSGHLVSDVPVSLSGGDYTVEIWCKPSHYHRGTLVGLGFENPKKPIKQIQHQGFLLQTLRDDDPLTARLANSVPGSVRFLHRNPPNLDYRTGTSCYSTNLYQLRRWQHVVAAKEGPTMRLYVDGELSATAEDKTGIAAKLRVMVGEAYFRRTDTQGARTFFGQLDELAIYDRALSDEEVVRHFKAINAKVASLPASGDQANGISDAISERPDEMPTATVSSPIRL